jgi:hypothetical protein
MRSLQVEANQRLKRIKLSQESCSTFMNNKLGCPPYEWSLDVGTSLPIQAVVDYI